MDIFLFLLPYFILMFFWWKANNTLFTLYRKKENPDYPILPGEATNYLDRPTRFFKIYLTPIIMWQIVLQRHKDKEINKAARKVRQLLLIFFGIWIIQMFILTYVWGWYSS